MEFVVGPVNAEVFPMSRKSTGRGVGLFRMSRRQWLAGSLAIGLGGSIPKAQADEAGDAAAEESVRSRAKSAGLNLKGFGSNRSGHYLAVGNAGEAFRVEALDLCEKLSATYQTTFKAKGFQAPLPRGRMALVVMADRVAYEAFKGEPAGASEGGHYDIDADRLVMYDFRAGGAIDAGANTTRLNTFTLVHEAIHQLTFDTGLLARKADVPVAVSEGLATYGETWLKARQTMGRVNDPRLSVLKKPGAVEWIEVEDLLTRDALFSDAATEQIAYAEAWLLVYHLLKTPAKAAKLRMYLESLNTRRDSSHRAEDAAEALGNLAGLDRELKKASRLLP